MVYERERGERVQPRLFVKIRASSSSKERESGREEAKATTHFRWRSCISRPTRLMTWGEMFSNDERSDIFLLFMAGAEHNCLPNHALLRPASSVGEARRPTQRDGQQKLGSSLIPAGPRGVSPFLSPLSCFHTLQRSKGNLGGCCVERRTRFPLVSGLEGGNDCRITDSKGGGGGMANELQERRAACCGRTGDRGCLERKFQLPRPLDTAEPPSTRRHCTPSNHNTYYPCASRVSGAG